MSDQCLRYILTAFIASFLPLAAVAQTPASADADAGRITLELNNASDSGAGACRLTFVAANRTDQGYDAVSWQVGVFDAKGIVRSILVLEFGGLEKGRTKIVQFDLPGRTCADVSRIVVNDAASCRPVGVDADAPMAAACLDALTPRSRTDIAFEL